MSRPIFRVYVEGGLYQETKTRSIALRVANKARAMGFNVTLEVILLATGSRIITKIN